MQTARDVICLSHLRWDFVFQRPNHLMTRAARKRRVFYVEEPVFGAPHPFLETREVGPNVTVVLPHLRDGLTPLGRLTAERALLDDLCEKNRVREPLVWLYTPMALDLVEDLSPSLVVYDCMDELSAFAGAPAALRAHETLLLTRADLVFTGGQSLCQAKRAKRRDAHLFPSSVDVEHFKHARFVREQPADQRDLPGPRLGFFGVIDERMDLSLLEGIARARPDWSLVMLGPVVKIDPVTLPRLPNIHYLGRKSYSELPSYLSGWDVAMMPFALNEATRFISPTKTLEYLAGGRPVVSSPIRDVVSPYGERGLVQIAATAAEFVAAAERLLQDGALDLQRVDAFLAQGSWDETWRSMERLIDECLSRQRTSRMLSAET